MGYKSDQNTDPDWLKYMIQNTNNTWILSVTRICIGVNSSDLDKQRDNPDDSNTYDPDQWHLDPYI